MNFGFLNSMSVMSAKSISIGNIPRFISVPLERSKIIFLPSKSMVIGLKAGDVMTTCDSMFFSPFNKNFNKIKSAPTEASAPKNAAPIVAKQKQQRLDLTLNSSRGA